MILFQVQKMLLGDGDSRPNSLRFDFVSCAPLDKKDKATGKGNGKESPAIFYRAVALSCCGEDKVIFLFSSVIFSVCCHYSFSSSQTTMPWL